jgi:hypothetical protein
LFLHYLSELEVDWEVHYEIGMMVVWSRGISGPKILAWAFVQREEYR